jgi:hypothetical protein
VKLAVLFQHMAVGVDDRIIYVHDTTPGLSSTVIPGELRQVPRPGIQEARGLDFAFRFRGNDESAGFRPGL